MVGLIAAEAAKHGLTEWNTGGGCMALVKDFPVYRVLVTDEDSNLPADNQPWVICLDSPDETTREWKGSGVNAFGPALREALQAAEGGDDDLTPMWLATLHYNGQREGARRLVVVTKRTADPYEALREAQMEACRRDGASICITGLSAVEIPRDG